jgi:hypothetical protein
MLMTYEAILEGNKLKWKGAAPRQVTEKREIAVYVTILDTPPHEEPKAPAQGREMADALAALAALDNRSITDPLAWQEETRQDRPLPRE